MTHREKVSLAACPSTAEDEDIVRRTEETIQALGDYGAKLRQAKKIAVKINTGTSRITLTDGRQTELTEPAVVEGTLRAIRAVTDAPIVIGDTPTDGAGFRLYEALGYPERLAKFDDVTLLDFDAGELVEVPMRHPDALFRSYLLHHELTDADAFVSIAKMKAHASMGFTLCIKNLFGWTPPSVYGAPRHYLHDRLIRLPRVLADLTAHFQPCLNVVDGIVAANNSEWGGTPMRPGLLLAGTDIVATDSIGARVMGFDPCGDFPLHPFFYRRNVLTLAAAQGTGSPDPQHIEVIGLSPEAVAQPFRVFRYNEKESPDETTAFRSRQIRRGAACVAQYRERQAELSERFTGRLLSLHDGEVLNDAPDIHAQGLWETDANRTWDDPVQFVVRCLPPDREIENFDWYADEAANLPEPTAVLAGAAASSAGSLRHE